MIRVRDDTGQEWIILPEDRYYSTLSYLIAEGLDLITITLPRILFIEPDLYGSNSEDWEIDWTQDRAAIQSQVATMYLTGILHVQLS